jgi:hypothetical protein
MLNFYKSHKIRNFRKVKIKGSGLNMVSKETINSPPRHIPGPIVRGVQSLKPGGVNYGFFVIKMKSML